MRFGEHDVVIDPRLLMNTGPLEGQKAGLWVEGLLMISTEPQTTLPHPESLTPGLTVDSANRRILSRFSLGTVCPIDVVAQQPVSELWHRYLPALLIAGVVGLVFIALWTVIVLRYSRQRLSLAAELHDAIVKGHLKVKYQPIINMANGRCYGAESLARWIRVNGEEVSPDVFIPIVEEAGLCDELAIAMLKTILQEMSNYLCKYPDVKINLNLSAQNLATNTVSDFLDEQLRATGVPASAICLEITERALVDTDDASERIKQLRKRGHLIAIDDFGTGYSSLSYLERFELDILKVDKRFIDAIETDGVISNVIGHIIDMAKSLKLDVVAEGIESGHQVDWLVNQQVLLGQGYVFSKPLSVKQFVDFAFTSTKEENKVIKFRAASIK
jgi:sensor c-di-GMP phosphodiesterase-like protein